MLIRNISFKRILLSLILISALVLFISGCKSESDVVPVESISITAANNATTISVIGGSLQFTAVVLPEDADDKSVVWSVEHGTGEATISSSGLLTAVSNGTINVRATSVDDPDISATSLITISNQEVLVSEIEILSAGDVNVINTFGGTLQFTANVSPTNAADKSVVWSVVNGTGSATISSNGLLTAVSNGTVTVKATSGNDALIFEEMLITISNQEVLVSSISVIGFGASSTISTFGGTLQMVANILPLIASDQSVVWSVVNGTGSATISSSGLLSAISNGTVIVTATSSSQPLISGTHMVTISNQVILVSSIELMSAGNADMIDVFDGTLQFSVNILPINAADKTVVWSVENGTGEATINQSGLLTAVSNGTVTVVVTSNSNSSIDDSMVIMISNQDVLVTSVVIASAGNVNFIDTFGGTLLFTASILPLNASDKTVVWSVENGSGEATISMHGLLSAVANGSVTVKATSNSDPSVFDTMVIMISNQEILVTSISVTGYSDVATISTYGGTLQMIAYVLPLNAADHSVIWSVENVTGEATIDQEGLLTAVANGTVIVTATSATQPLISGTHLITITNQVIVVTSIELVSDNDAIVIDTFGGTLQFTANILPIDAVDQTLLWSVENGTGEASIDQNGLLTAISNGTVTVKVEAANNDLIFDTMVITLSNQDVLVTSVVISSEGDVDAIDVFGGTLQFTAAILPLNAADKSVVWSVENGTGEAMISENGLLTAISNGTVTVKATSNSDPLINDTMVIMLTNQDVLVTSVAIASDGDVVMIDTFGGILQFTATVLPLNAADKSVVWSVENGTGEATISSSGLLTAVSNGTVTVIVTSNSDPLLFASMVITISNQEVLVTSVSVNGFGDVATISTLDGTLQMVAYVLPQNATDKSVVWSVENGTGEATIDQNGLLTAISNGTVTVTATSVDQVLISGSHIVTISNQEVAVDSIELVSAGDVTVIDTFDGTLQFTANVLPIDADDPSVIWSVANGTGEATIDQNGLLTAVSSGSVTVKVEAASNALLFDTMVIMLSNQEVLVTSIAISSDGDVVVIDTFDGTLQFFASILPVDADDQSVLWSVVNGTGEATIDENGLLTAVSSGVVTVKVAVASNALLFDTMDITLSNQEVLVTSITVSALDDIIIIDTLGGTLQMIATVLPIDAADQSVVWSVENITGEATIDQAGILTAVANGSVIVKATSGSNLLIYGTLEITLSNQDVVVEPEAPVELLTAGDFTILTKTGISTAADSLVVGNMGVSPVAATYITGFSLILDSSTQYSTSAQVVGMIYASDYSTPTPAYLTQAISDMEAAYTDAASRAPDFTELHAGNLSGQTLVGGVYKYGTDVVLYSNVILSGSAEDVWIFQISGNLTQAVSVQIILEGGALAENVFWQIAGGVAIETSAHFVGIILSMTEIALGTNATVNGKLLSQTAVTLDSNTVSMVEIIEVESVTVSSEADVTIIDTFRGTLQMYAEVLPLDATNKAVYWTVENGTGEASIDEAGLLTALADGTVVVKATSATDPLLFDTMELILSNQAVLVASISLVGDGADFIDTFGGTLQILETVLPVDAENKAVTWSVENGTGEATISELGLLTAVANGLVTVKATSVENIEIFGLLEITISNQEILVESISVWGEGNVQIIDVSEGTLQMYAEVLPLDAADPSYTWSVENGTGEATISELGLLTAVLNGIVTVKATSVENTAIFGFIDITLSNQVEPVVVGGVDLGSAADFVILSKTGISSTVGTLITGNIGVSPGPASYITGFSLIVDASGEYATSTLVVGMVYAADYAVPTPSYLSVAVSDMQAAYTDAAGRAPDFTELYAGDISGQTLVPGVYYWSSGLLINTDITLSGGATDVWIFQIAGTLTQAAGVQVLLAGGAFAENIVWQVAAAVAIGVGAHFEGTILGMTSIDLGTNASMNGRLFAQTAVTLDANAIN